MSEFLQKFHPEIRSIVTTIDLHSRLMPFLLEDITPEQALWRMNKDQNHAVWLTGHIVSNRFYLANLFGVPDKAPYGRFFDGGEPIDDAHPYPGLSELLEQFNSVSPKLMQAMQNVTNELLQQPTPMGLPVKDKTMLGTIGFFVHHESYHMGQLGYLRKLLGLSAMRYF